MNRSVPLARLRPPVPKPIHSIEQLLEGAERVIDTQSRARPPGAFDQAWVIIEQQQRSAQLLRALRRFRFDPGVRERLRAALQRVARENAAAWPDTLKRAPPGSRRDFALIQAAFPTTGLNLRHPGVLGTLAVLVVLSIFLNVGLLISGVINLLGVMTCFVLTTQSNKQALDAAARQDGEYDPVWRFQRQARTAPMRKHP